MKKLLAIALLAVMPLAYADHHAQKEPATKRVCVMELDNKTKKEKEVCKTIKIHKKLEGTKIDGAKKDSKK
jgi:hypothetical protein